MKRYQTGLAFVGVASLTALATIAAAKAYWRPAMPAFVIHLRAASGQAFPPSLMLIYGDRGSDPLRNGTLAPDGHVSDCAFSLSHEAANATCISSSARREFHVGGQRRQSLQIRSVNGRGNPIIGGLLWYGPAHPNVVTVHCDLAITDPRKACGIAAQP